MILHTTEVTPLSDYRLFLRFNNGDAGEVDLSGELDGEVFEPLRDPAQFATAYQPLSVRRCKSPMTQSAATKRLRPGRGKTPRSSTGSRRG